MLKVKVVIENENNKRVGETKTLVRVKIPQGPWVAANATSGLRQGTWAVATDTSGSM